MVKEKSQKRLLNSLEKGIVEIAWRIDFITWWKMRRQLKGWRKKSQEDIQKEVQEYMMMIMKFAMENQELIQNQMQSSIEENEDEKQ